MEISQNNLIKEINSISDGYWVPGNKHDSTCEYQKYLAVYDPTYAAPTKAQVSQFLKEARNSFPENRENKKIWDCDQYSRHLWVEAAKYCSKVGISYKWTLGMISGRFFFMADGNEDHTCNWVYMDNGTFCFIEPQYIIKPQDSFTFYDFERWCVRLSINLMIV